MPLLPKLSHRVTRGVELRHGAGVVETITADVEHIEIAAGVIDRDADSVGEGPERAQEGMRRWRQRRVGARLEGADEVRRGARPGDIEVGGVLDAV